MSFSKTRDRSIDHWLTSDESSKPAFTVLVLTLLWFLVCMAYFIFNFDILSWPYLERYGIWIVLALALVGAICFFLGLVWLRKKPFSAIAIMVLVAIVFAGHFSSYGYTLGARIRFAMAFRHYENELDRILGPNRDTLPTPSDDYLIDRGPPIRLAFIWQRHATQRVLLVWDRRIRKKINTKLRMPQNHLIRQSFAPSISKATGTYAGSRDTGIYVISGSTALFLPPWLYEIRDQLGRKPAEPTSADQLCWRISLANDLSSVAV